mmetsp:Transcript_40638/g.71526  ORF Transcript_40638/g.71526 Transcript_40638/m.71526 type:complete len:364 (-) Transcript_40638:88-1179(-)
MCKTVVMLAWLVYAGHGRQVRSYSESKTSDLKALAQILLTSNPAVAFTLSSLGVRSPALRSTNFALRPVPVFLQDEPALVEPSTDEPTPVNLTEPAPAPVSTQEEVSSLPDEPTPVNSSEPAPAPASTQGEADLANSSTAPAQGNATGLNATGANATEPPQERRIDATDGGVFTESEFLEYYGDRFEEMWSIAIPLGDMRTPDMFKVGEKVNGTVMRVAPFGAFVDIGATTDALLHISQISDEFVSDPFEKLEEGQELKCMILEVDGPRQKVSVTCKSRGIGRAFSDFKVGEEVDGKILKLTSFGAFVDIGAQYDALLHVSEDANETASDMSENVQEGETIKCRIKEIDVDRKRIGVSCLTSE